MYKIISIGIIILTLFAGTAFAMRSGPTNIIECPNCQGLYRQLTITSGNTINARCWSDGYFKAPMLPRFPAITRCKNCGCYFWVSDSKVIDQLFSPSWDIKYPGAAKKRPVNDYADKLYVPALSLNELAEAIEKGMGNTNEREIYLRIQYWHNANHLRRNTAPTFLLDKDNQTLVQNLHRLLELLDDNNANQRLYKAEIFRELGRFDESETMLNYAFPAGLQKTVGELTTLNKAQNSEIYYVDKKIKYYCFVMASYKSIRKLKRQECSLHCIPAVCCFLFCSNAYYECVY